MSEKIYEMLWDCAFCGSRKLLGKTHRFCPGCGAAQDPAKRYFPPDAEKVAVEDHEYFGSDRVCASCQAASSARVKFCGGCGSPMQEGHAVRLVEASPAPASSASPASSSTTAGRWVLGALALGAAALAAAFLLWKKAVILDVTAQEWSREIRIEKLLAVREEAWCDEMPPAARSIWRRREERSKKQVPDGEDCRPVKKDRGDGTFSESQECVPRFREEPVLAEKCEYVVDRWRPSRSERSQGAGLSPEPSWPKASLEKEGECPGCERFAGRIESYAVSLAEPGRVHRCEFSSQEAWAAMVPGTRWRAQARGMTGALLCDKLARAE